MPAVIDDDLYADEVIADPYAYYGWLREVDPVHWNARYETWVVTRYADIVWLLRRPELFSSRFYADDQQPPSPPIAAGDMDELRFVSRFRSSEFIQNDPPEHSRMRNVVNRFFTPGRMELWRGMVREVVDTLLTDVESRDRFDVLPDLAAQLPLRVIAELLGVPADDRQSLKEHADRRMRSALSLAPDRMRVAASGIRDTSDYLEAALDGGRTGAAGSLLEILHGAETTGSSSRAETLANAQLLIDAGHETTVQLICNGMLALLTHREQWDRLVADPAGLAAGATEECLRYDPPLPAPRRLVAQDVELGGSFLRRGQRVVFVLAAGNRDPRVFPDPDRFDITRSPNRHVVFGSGMHVCLGQYLARMEGQEVFRALATRMPDLELTDKPVQYAKVRGVRSLLGLPVRRQQPAGSR